MGESFTHVSNFNRLPAFLTDRAVATSLLTSVKRSTDGNEENDNEGSSEETRQGK